MTSKHTRPIIIISVLTMILLHTHPDSIVLSSVSAQRLLTLCITTSLCLNMITVSYSKSKIYANTRAGYSAMKGFLTGSRTRWYFPKRSMTHASCCGTNRMAVLRGRRERCRTCCWDCCSKACMKSHTIDTSELSDTTSYVYSKLTDIYQKLSITLLTAAITGQQTNSDEFH